jgi:hypothetical protein
MNVTVVLFRAFNQDCKEVFLNKTPEEIHEVLMDICETYQTVGILEFTEFEHKPISVLDDFTRPEKFKLKH